VRLAAGSRSPEPAPGLFVRTLTLEQLRGYRADRNPAPERFPHQDASVTPLAERFAGERGLDPYAPPALADLFDFVRAYAGPAGESAGKTASQRTRARHLRFDLELKRVPFYPALIDDGFDGKAPALFEERVLQAVHAAGVVERTAVRSFDHRCVRVLKQVEPRLGAGILIAETAPVEPARLVRQALADTYCPGFHFLDEGQVRSLQQEGVRVLPWTVNEEADWQRLLDWGVDGITTDYPGELAELLQRRGLCF
jgi:glycerophosphoryl diester phosphodiesterase